MHNTLKWYLIFTLSILAAIICSYFGVFKEIWLADLTKLSFIIMALYLFTSIKCGIDLKNFESNGNITKGRLEFGWFMSEVSLSLGMVGTIIGFIIIMSDFSSVDFTNTSTIQELIKSLGSGVSTALYTTLMGLIASVMIKIQYFIFDQAVVELHGIKDD